MKKFSPITLISFAILLTANIAIAQTVPVGSLSIEDTYRREQLLGHVDSNISFTIRPLSAAALPNSGNIFDPDHSLKKAFPDSNNGIYKTSDGNGFIQLLPITWQQQYNTHNPYGWNDGNMIPSAGYETLFSAGVFVKYKFLSIQIAPEVVYAQNKNFEGFTDVNNSTQEWKAWYGVQNSTDLPERFGNRAYSKLFPGQSNIRLTFDPVSVGISTENLWWGPGIRSSLLMSNNATGFLHATLNTTRPVKTPIGSFEAQLISGKLVGSGYPALVPGQPGNRDAYFNTKPNDWRYLSALAITYHPKWVPGLFLGLERAFQVYHTDLGHGFGDYFPVFTPYLKDATYNPTTGLTGEDAKNRDQLTSVFVRWIWTDAHAEVYFEYGKNDHNWNLRDFITDPEHSRAYILGLKKIYKMGARPNEYIQFNVELTQLGQPADDIVERNSGFWYTHGQIRQGYTNNGQVLGAGIGPGSNLQSVDISWFSGIKQIGLQFERYEHDADLYYKEFIAGDLLRHWVDLSIGLHSDWNYKHFIISGKLIYIDQLNYEWKLNENPAVFYFNQKYLDVNNFQLALSVSYRF